MGYRVRDYEAKDREHLFRLIEDVWGKSASASSRRLWKWMFEDNPATSSGEPTMLVLEHDSGIVGMVLSFPSIFKVGGRLVTISYCVDLMVHPRHKGRGMLLMRGMMQRPRLFLGIPTFDSYPIWKKLGVEGVCRLFSMTKIVNLEHVIKKKMRTAPVRRLMGVAWRAVSAVFDFCAVSFFKDDAVSVEEVRGFGEEVDDFWQEARAGYDVIVVCDRKFLNWRFFEYPERDYSVYAAKRGGRFAGYIVFRDEEAEDGTRRGYIVDFLVKAGDCRTLGCLIRKAAASLSARKTDRIICTLVEGSMYRAVFRQHGFFFENHDYNFVIWHKFSSFLGQQPKGPIHWFITRADSDLDR